MAAPLSFDSTVAGVAACGRGMHHPDRLLPFVFRNLLNAGRVTHADIVPHVPDQAANFSDISGGVDAFQGASFPYAGPDTCP